MSLQFILGNSGSGKTDYTFQAIVKEASRFPKKNYLILVPEQFTLQTQKKLVELSPEHAIMNIDVLSFKRLAYRVFDELGMTTMNVLEDTGKNLLLRKVAGDCREKLTVLSPNISRMGYIDEVKSLISELVQYNVGPQQLRQYAAGSEVAPVFAAKLSDIALLYEAFEQDMQGRFITAEEILTVLISVAGESSIIRDSVIVLDEFTGFTPIQNQLIQRLLPLAERIQVILSIDHREDFYHCEGMQELFYLTKKTIHSLSDMASECNIPVLAPIVYADNIGMRYKDAPDLAFLEQNLFRKCSENRKGEVQELHITSLYNPREEMIWIAREIHRLVKEEGLRYRDIAVVSGEIEQYGNYADEILSRYQIPYFLDSTNTIVFHPFIELVRAALQVIAEDYSHEAVFRFLRTGFSDLSDREVDLLDLYISATGIRGRKQWTNRWLREMRDVSLCTHEDMELLRQRIMGHFLPLDGVFHDKKSTVHEQILALYHFLTGIHAEEQLWKREEDCAAAGEQTMAAVNGQIYRIVIQLLEKFDSLLGSEHMNVEDFSEVLDAGLTAAKVAAVPPGYDSVILGDMERTRLNHIKVLFLIGVNDGVIPKPVSAGGILSEFEREQMEESDINLAPGAREQTFIQRFYLYRNLTKPSKGLYLSFSRVDTEGKDIFPSYLIDTVRAVFPDLTIQEIDRIQETLCTATVGSAKEYLIHGQKNEDWYALAACFLEKEPENTRRLLEAEYTSYTEDPISRIICDALYGRHLKGSVTRLERFAACAYAHFLQYGLRLKEKETCGFENTDMGEIYHEALRRYSQKLAESEYDWFTVTDSKREEYCMQAMEETLREASNLAIFDTQQSLHQTKRMEKILNETVWALTRQVRAGSFVPSLFEVSFHEVKSPEELKIQLDMDHTMELVGRIDRVDFMQEDGKQYVKVIDYKSGKTEFDLLKVYHGLSLQLMVYLNTALELAGQGKDSLLASPAAVLYYQIDDPAIEDKSASGMSEEDILAALLKELRPNGLVNQEECVIRGLDHDLVQGSSSVIPVSKVKGGALGARSSVTDDNGFSIIRDYTQNLIRENAKQIYSGKVSAEPYQYKRVDSCMYCPYTSICGIHSRIPGYTARTFTEMDKADVIEAMERYNVSIAGEMSRK